MCFFAFCLLLGMIGLRLLLSGSQILGFFIRRPCSCRLLFAFLVNGLCLFVMGIDLLVLFVDCLYFLWIFLDYLVFLDFILLESYLLLLLLLCENSELILFLAISLLWFLSFIRSDLILLLPYQAVSFICLYRFLNFFACSLILSSRLCFQY